MTKDLFPNPDCFSHLSKVKPKPKGIDLLSHFGYETGHQYYRLLKDSYINFIIALFDKRHRQFPLNMIQYLGKDVKKLAIDENEATAGIEEELLLCQKSAYIGYDNDLRAYRDHLHRNYPGTKEFRVTKNPMNFGFTAWTFGINNRHRVVRNFVAVFEMGIYDKVNEYATKNKVKKDDNVVRNISEKVFSTGVGDSGEIANKLELSGSILTVFVCWGCDKFVAGCVFLAEICYMKLIRVERLG